MYMCENYGQFWVAPEFEELVEMVDNYAEERGLRAQSIVAWEVEEVE